jgi:hypothetical protein
MQSASSCHLGSTLERQASQIEGVTDIYAIDITDADNRFSYAKPDLWAQLQV